MARTACSMSRAVTVPGTITLGPIASGRTPVPLRTMLAGLLNLAPTHSGPCRIRSGHRCAGTRLSSRTQHGRILLSGSSLACLAARTFRSALASLRLAFGHIIIRTLRCRSAALIDAAHASRTLRYQRSGQDYSAAKQRQCNHFMKIHYYFFITGKAYTDRPRIRQAGI